MPFPLPHRLVVFTSLFVSRLRYFSEVYFLCSAACDVAPQRVQVWACAQSPGMTVVLLGVSLMVSFPDLSVKLSVSFGITPSC